MKKSILLSAIAILVSVYAFSQRTDDPSKKNYRATAEKTNDLVHTKLDVKFDYQKQYMYGKAWITLKPHFYPQDSLVLDAKGMTINKIALAKKDGTTSPLMFSYPDSMQLVIRLDKKYTSTENYTVFIDYVARPNELKTKGSAAITDAKGLYFINPLGKDTSKPTEIWTQGETESSSVWFPTTDKPNQKTTAEISMTVPSKYVTLSNGLLKTQKPNTDGTRTDTWVMDLPHSPYLFFMGVGDFAIVKDSWKGKEVSYYVEKKFEKVARKIFGLTPEMIQFYSTKLGVDFPWAKYSQMVGRDYVSGAMENTTATLHSEYLQQNARQLTDGNKYEDYVAHELFHQWFGDLVTAESWSNLTVNESFANYSETLWDEYKYGTDAAGYRNYRQMHEYFESRSENKNLVRFYYNDKEDVFDRVTYEKGGRILNMLRYVVGDDAFFKSLNLYLTRNKFQNAEAQQLRLAFEEVTGKDLNWFWNEWYYGSGHPKLDINYGYNDTTKAVTVTVNQTQTGDKLFRFPVAIDLYTNGVRNRYNVWLANKSETFTFASASKPELINFDGDKVLLCEKNENKTMQEYAYQFAHGGKFLDRMEAVDYAIENYSQAGAKELLLKALSDRFYKIRQSALESIKFADLDASGIKTIESIARADEKRVNRAAAVDILAESGNKNYAELYSKGVTDSSYTVAGSSLVALASLDESKAVSMLPELRKDAKGRLKSAIEEVNALTKGDADFDKMTASYDSVDFYQKMNNYRAYLSYLGNVDNTAHFKKGIDKVVSLRNLIAPYQPDFKDDVNAQLEKIKVKKQKKRTETNAKDIDEQIAYLDKKLR